MTKQWKHVKNKEDYIIFDDGTVIRLPHILVDIVGRRLPRSFMVLNQNRRSNSGYDMIRVGTDEWYVHRLVAEHFVENDDVEKDQVNHIDGNKLNNHASNLEWVTQSENMIHASENNLLNKDSSIRKKQTRINSASTPAGKEYKKWQNKRVAHFNKNDILVRVYSDVYEIDRLALCEITTRQAKVNLKGNSKTLRNGSTFRFV